MIPCRSSWCTTCRSRGCWPGTCCGAKTAGLSRLYAQDCLGATADPARYEFHVAYVSPDGRWRFPADLSQAAIGAAALMPLDSAVRYLTALRPDVMLPQMFCLPGMTSYRALFDVLGVPYVGSPPAVMALGADKAHAKAVVAAAGVRVLPGEVLRPGDRPSLAPPAVVKPVDGDNSWSRSSSWAGKCAAASSSATASRVREAARHCHLALGCRDYSLFDFRTDPAGQPWFLEAGLYCSFARKSAVSVMAAAAGIPLPELFEVAIRESTGHGHQDGDSD